MILEVLVLYLELEVPVLDQIDLEAPVLDQIDTEVPALDQLDLIDIQGVRVKATYLEIHVPG